jgi:hypothetical protein
VFAATAATWPGIALLLGVIWCWLARFSDRSVTALILRRYRFGRRRADLPMAVALSPWHLVVSAGLTLAGLIVPVLVAMSAAFCATLGVSALTSSTVGPAMAPSAAAGFAAGMLIAWWGPGGASLRRGSRSLVRGVARGETVTAVVVGALLLAAAVLTALAFVRHGQLTWWPFRGGSGPGPFRRPDHAQGTERSRKGLGSAWKSLSNDLPSWRRHCGTEPFRRGDKQVNRPNSVRARCAEPRQASTSPDRPGAMTRMGDPRKASSDAASGVRAGFVRQGT